MWSESDDILRTLYTNSSSSQEKRLSGTVSGEAAGEFGRFGGGRKCGGLRREEVQMNVGDPKQGKHIR